MMVALMADGTLRVGLTVIFLCRDKKSEMTFFTLPAAYSQRGLAPLHSLPPRDLMVNTNTLARWVVMVLFAAGFSLTPCRKAT